MFGGKLVWSVIIVLRMEMTDMPLVWSVINFMVSQNRKAFTSVVLETIVKIGDAFLDKGNFRIM